MSRASTPEADPVQVSEDLTPLPRLKQAGEAQIDFDGQLEGPLVIREDARAGCGGHTWPAGMVLGKHLLRYHRSELQQAKILELGAGSGLVGLAVALAGGGCGPGGKLMLTDQQAMLQLLEHNIRRNEVESRAAAHLLDWGTPLPEAVLRRRPDMIVAGECVYFEPAFPALLATLKQLLALNDQATVYFCFKKRRRADMRFVKQAKALFAVEDLFDEDRPKFSRESIFLFSIRSRKAADADGALARETAEGAK